MHTAQLSLQVHLAAQVKYNRLNPESRQASPHQPPTLEEVNSRVAAAKKLTVRDVWGLMLTTVPGRGMGGTCLKPSCLHCSRGHKLC